MKKAEPTRLKKTEIIQRIVQLFQSEPTRIYNYKQVASAIEITNEPQRIQVNKLLEQMAAVGDLLQLSPGKYRLNNRGRFVEGTFERKGNGKNLLLPNDGGDPIFIAERNSNGAMDGDKVIVIVYAKRHNRELEGEVSEIIARGKREFVGVLEVQNGYAFLVTDNKKLANDIFIPLDKLKGGETNDKAVVRITDWPSRAKNPIGEVVDILGKAGENNTEIHAILAEYGLPYKYPEEVEKAANLITEGITPEEVARREDFRGVTTFTIDPHDAKDFDDALSIRTLPNGNREVGVHIADVTHYVTPESIIESEAEQRATSVYLVDRVVPMLPEHLSNGVCSLRPNEEKLCFAAIFELDDKANVLNSRIGRTVICSDRRFSYEEAQAIIEGGEGDFKEELLALNDLARQLRDKRFQAGAIAFDRHEVRFDIDETGRPISVYFKISKEANKLIEEFMLLANRTVAEFVGKARPGYTPKTFVYRIHDLPDSEKLNNFATFIRRFGYTLHTDGSRIEVSKSINSLLDSAHGRREENLIETVAIRTMAKAIYSTENIGHYGLAFDYYTHFTSPIRRYPDMMVHRLLTRYLAGEKSVNQGEYEEKCEHSSDMEQLAANAERASIKYKQAEYLGERLGQEFDGVISGVTEWGLYVEINENKCEGLVPMRDLDDDFYEFDPLNYCLIGRRNRRIYRLGDAVRIQIARANLERKQVDFALISADTQDGIVSIDRNGQPKKSRNTHGTAMARGEKKKKNHPKGEKKRHDRRR